MCGIQGINEGDETLIRLMNVCTKHRGPDDTGFFSNERVSLGHNRLAIIDLSPAGRQPMSLEGANLRITFNGEIYNFEELRGEMREAGVVFQTKSDTEVILRGYETQGTSFLKRLRGMWAFAIYDMRENKIVLSRDPFGIKPLYYYLRDGHFGFSSELRGLRPLLTRYGYTDNVLAHHLYFTFGYMPAPHAPFTEVKKLLPGAIAEFDLSTNKLAHRETLLPYDGVSSDMSLTNALDDTVRAHFVSDVPVGLFYSGGIDSTLLLARAKKLGFDPAAFFLRIPNRLDNDYALRAAYELGVTPTIFDMTERDVLEGIERLGTSLDEPFADSSYIPTEFLSREVAKSHKVVLSGEGGDEFFGGYHRHNHLLGLTKGLSIVPQSLTRRLPSRVRRVIESKINRDPYASYLEFTRADEGLGDRTEALEFLKERTKGTLHDDLAFAIDQALYLPDDLLFKIDRAGMQHGLEGRLPFLDKHFFTTARALSAKARHGGGATGKVLLKDILRTHISDELVDRPKQGFSFPLKMLKGLPQEYWDEALDIAKKNPQLIPFPPESAMLRPQSKYALLVWSLWRKNFVPL